MAEHILRFGKLSVLYENGFLRYVRAGGDEVIRLIYLAVRNQHWETAPMKILAETIESNDENFSIAYEGINTFGEKEYFRWKVRIEGQASGVLSFEASGEALDTFQRNRAGVCLLHPAATVLGKRVSISHSDGSQSTSKFPVGISAHQPFLDIQRFTWPAGGTLVAQLDFEGDIFETEDQRNWTDASFKTYSTPLSIPIPVTLHRGDKVYQKVTLRLSGLEVVKTPTPPTGPVRILVDEKSEVRFPTIGTSHAAGQPLPGPDTITELKKLAFDHLRIELNFSTTSWGEVLDRALREARLLGLPLELALLFDKNPASEWSAFMNNLGRNLPAVVRIAIFSTQRRASPDDVVASLAPLARAVFPDAAIGAGSAGYFVDVNRHRFQFDRSEFIMYSVTPQVHAVDARTIVENAEAQRDTVLYAKEITGNKPIVVSPVTLRPRVASRKPGHGTGRQSVLPPDVDVRQPTGFAAGWTLASIKYLAEAGVSSVTFYESHGMKGFLMAPEDDFHPDFPSTPGKFPLYNLMEAIRWFKPTHVVLSSTDEPLRLSSLVLQNAAGRKVVVANHAPDRVSIRLGEEVHHLEGYGIGYF